MIVSQSHLPMNHDVLRAQLKAWRQRWPAMGVLALVPEAEKAQLPLLQTLCRAETLPLVGAVFPALVTGEGFSSEGVWLVGLNPMPPHFLLADIQQDGIQRLADATATLVLGAGTLPSQVLPTVFMVFDAMVPNISTLLSELQTLLPLPVSYGGVNAGSESFQPMPCLFDAATVVNGGVLGVLLSPQSEVIVQHGYPVSRCLMQATSASGNRIESIDHRPAFEVYQHVIQQEYGVRLTRDNFYDYAVHFPFGLVTAVDVLVRIPVALNDDGSLFCVGEVPPNSMLRLLAAPKLDDSDCIARIVERLRAGDEAMQAGAVLTFYCAGRRMHFGSDAQTELAQLQTAIGTPTVYGALTLGEIDTVDDLNMPRFHNAAVVCVRS